MAAVRAVAAVRTVAAVRAVATMAAVAAVAAVLSAKRRVTDVQRLVVAQHHVSRDALFLLATDRNFLGRQEVRDALLHGWKRFLFRHGFPQTFGGIPPSLICDLWSFSTPLSKRSIGRVGLSMPSGQRRQHMLGERSADFRCLYHRYQSLPPMSTT